MNWILVPVILLIMTGPASAMQIEADPRSIVAFMDKSLSPELDILRVTTDISPDNHLIFQVKTRGERLQGENNDYLLLYIMQEKTYVLLLPINKGKESQVLVYERLPQSESNEVSRILGKFKEDKHSADFNATSIFRGGEFSIPLTWLDFNADFSFDAYTVQASINGDILQINKVYDQARKGRPEEKRFSAIALLNKICSPK
jgi:hypothetical protein